MSAPKEGPVVVVGAGQAACQFVASLRQHGYKGPLTMIGDEPSLPYQRPPLSKAYLAGTATDATLQLRPRAFYEALDCEVRIGQGVQHIDRQRSEAVMADGTRVPYQALVLATGASARSMPGLPEGDARIHYLRSVSHAAALKAALGVARRIAIVGAGYVGMEVAATARQHGLQVTVLESASRVMQRSIGEAISRDVQAIHEAHGVELRLNSTILGVEARPESLRIAMDADTIDMDALVVGIGAAANIQLAQEAGIACARGILVDEQARTSDPKIFAVGDCTEQTHALYGPGLRLESVANAIEQAKVAASVLAGKPLPPAAVPWFWSDQYSHRLQVAGLPHGHDEIVLRSPAEPQPGKATRSAWYLRQGRVLAVEALDAPEDFMVGRNLIRAGTTVQAARLADASQSLQPASAKLTARVAAP